MLGEWRDLDASFGQTDFRGGVRSDAERASDRLSDLNSRISVVESRVFGKRPKPYPDFASFEQWAAWRLPLAHPKLSCDDSKMGWTLEFFRAALDDAQLSF